MQTFLVCLLLVVCRGMSFALMYDWCGNLEVFSYMSVDGVDFLVKVIRLMWNDTESELI